MKKLLLVLASIFVVFLACIYLFIPSNITFSKVYILNTKVSIANRLLLNKNYWHNWWPSDTSGKKPVQDKNDFVYNNYNYSLDKKMMNTGEITISGTKISLKSILNIISVTNDSVAVNWTSEMPASSDPFKRIKNYIYARQIKNSMTGILESFQAFLKKTENIYGLSIGQIQVKDTILISAKFLTQQYPSTPDIYATINNLKQYIAEAGAGETNSPMLNIIHDSTNYRTMIAIPISKEIPAKNDYEIKRMVPGKILVTEVKGGQSQTDEAMRQLTNFLNDNNISSPAKPFESLVTNRSLEPDTSKWITKIYYPIF